MILCDKDESMNNYFIENSYFSQLDSLIIKNYENCDINNNNHLKNILKIMNLLISCATNGEYYILIEKFIDFSWEIEKISRKFSSDLLILMKYIKIEQPIFLKTLLELCFKKLDLFPLIKLFYLQIFNGLTDKSTYNSEFLSNENFVEYFLELMILEKNINIKNYLQIIIENILLKNVTIFNIKELIKIIKEQINIGSELSFQNLLSIFSIIKKILKRQVFNSNHHLTMFGNSSYILINFLKEVSIESFSFFLEIQFDNLISEEKFSLPEKLNINGEIQEDDKDIIEFFKSKSNSSEFKNLLYDNYQGLKIDSEYITSRIKDKKIDHVLEKQKSHTSNKYFPRLISMKSISGTCFEIFIEFINFESYFVLQVTIFNIIINKLNKIKGFIKNN